MQTILVTIVLIVAVGYASLRIFRIVKGTADPCDGCELKKNCKKFGQSRKI